MFWFILSLGISICSTLMLLSGPYLRITNLGWLISIWCIPFLGPIFFAFTFIRNPGRSQKTIPVSTDLASCEVSNFSASIEERAFNHLGLSNGFPAYTNCRDIQILRDSDFTQQLFTDIKSAQQRIWITTYILSGNVKNELCKVLGEAYERGVDVRLLVDRIGSSLTLPTAKAARDYLALPFPTSIFRHSFAKSIIYMEKRLHSKIVIVDDFAYIGSHNLRDEVLSEHNNFARNVSLKYAGSVVDQLESVFLDLWAGNSEGQEAMETKPQYGHTNTKSNCASSRIHFSSPNDNNLQYNRYLSALFYAARTRIYIWMPYLIPTKTMRDNIISASQLGLDVRVLIPKVSDSILVDNTHHLVLQELSDNGVKCAQSIGSFDHSKIMLIDNLVILGSTNLDYRSLFRNYEANIEIYDHKFSQDIVDIFDEEFNRAELVENYSLGKVRNLLCQTTSLIAGLY